MKYKTISGFSMIEILVSLAVIGLLVSAIMPAIRLAKERSADESIKENLANIRPSAQIYFENNGNSFGSDGTSCTNSGSLFDDPTIARQIGNATTTANRPGVCANSASAWVVSVPLPGGGSWCVDSDGTSMSGVADTVSLACP